MRRSGGGTDNHQNPDRVRTESASRRSCAGTPNPAQDRFHVSRRGTARHPHLNASDHDLDGGVATLMRGFIRLC
jgi:hypothetical protein